MIEAIAKELFLRRDEIIVPIETIYFGGGTPSLLTIEEINFLLATITDNFNVVENPEITLEANPDDLSEQVLINLSKTAISRLSIGVQSFFEDDLRAMNRAHSAEESLNCLKIATQYFNNITIDLIYGIPNMSSDKWKANLQLAFDLGVQHISSYALTVEPKTALDAFIKKGTYPKLEESLAASHFEILLVETLKQGFTQYEISNFGKQTFFSKHNTSYWEGKSYLGVGPSAHSYYDNIRSWNIANNSRYVKSLLKEELPNEYEILSKEDRFNEYIMIRLRTMWGVDLNYIETEFGEQFTSHLLDVSKTFIHQKLLRLKEKQLVTTDKGKFLIDGIASELFMI